MTTLTRIASLVSPAAISGPRKLRLRRRRNDRLGEPEERGRRAAGGEQRMPLQPSCARANSGAGGRRFGIRLEPTLVRHGRIGKRG